MENLSGLENLKYIGNEFEIRSNPLLNDLTALQNVNNVGFVMIITENDMLTSLNGLENIKASSIGSLYIDENPMLSECEVKSICDYLLEPGGTFIIENNEVGCNSPEEVLERCDFAVEEGYESNFYFYPNPATDVLCIKERAGDALEQLTIYNCFGQLLYEGSAQSECYDISFLIPGMYVAVIQSGKKILRYKLMKK